MRRLVFAVVPAALLLAACVPSEQPAALSAGNDFQSALRGRDVPGACALLSPEALHRLESTRGQACPAALGMLDLSTDAPRSIEVWGDNAQLLLPSGAVFLAKFQTGWKVTAAGCAPRPEQPYDCAVRG